MILSKKAGVELSLGTIVILVISVIAMIFLIIMVRSVMCSGIIITEDINAGVKNQIIDLFGEDSYGVKCLGEDSSTENIKLATGGRRKIICIIKTEENQQYQLNIKEIKSLKGASDATVNKWVLDKNWKGSVSPGGRGSDVSVLLMNIPSDAPATTLKITTEETRNNDPSTLETHISYVDVTPSGFFRTTLC